MVVINFVTIIIMKIKETYLDCKKRKRLIRLKQISEVEQKYLYFDYRKFFSKSMAS